MLATALTPAGMAFAAIRAGPRAPRARPLPARKAPRSARSAPACLRLAPRPGIAIGDGSRPARSRVLSPRDESDERASAPRAPPAPRAPLEPTSFVPAAPTSARGASIEADLDRARAAARAADDAASIAEREHEAFLMANKLLLDARAAQAETSRAAALRATEVAARARASAEDAARFAAAAHELALAEAQSESCAYAVESAAQNAKALEDAEGALSSSYASLEPECLTNAKKAELKREATERVARAARKEHAESAAALVRGRARAAAAAARAAGDAERNAAAAAASAAARLERNFGRPTLWDEGNEETEEEENVRRREAGREAVRKMSYAFRVSNAAHPGPTEANNIVPERVRPFRGARETVARDEAETRETMRRAARRADAEFVQRLRMRDDATVNVSDGESRGESHGEKLSGRPAETAGGGVGSRGGDGGGGGGGGESVPRAFLFRDAASDTIEPMPEWMYPRALDCVPAFFGKLNPLTGALVYYTGAVLRESAGAPVVAAQWTALVFLPALALQCFVRFKTHERNARSAHAAFEAEATERSARRAEAKKSAWPGVEDEDESFVRETAKPFPFLRANRTAWLDVHLGYALLCPAGAVGGEGASWWLLLPPIVMALRFAGERLAFMKQPRRILAVVGGALALAAVTLSASASLTQALASLRAGGAVGVALAPAAFAATFAFYLAPAALLPGAITRAWRGEGEWATGTSVSKPSVSKRVENAEERGRKRTWQVLGVVAMIASLATGSDVPIFLCFFAQLLKADPGALLQVMIDKGDKNRAAFDVRVADAAAAAVDAMKGKGAESDDSSDDASRPPSRPDAPGAA